MVRALEEFRTCELVHCHVLEGSLLGRVGEIEAGDPRKPVGVDAVVEAGADVVLQTCIDTPRHESSFNKRIVSWPADTL